MMCWLCKLITKIKKLPKKYVEWLFKDNNKK